jgi:hypothetical protein
VKCNFDKLCQFLNKELGPAEESEVAGHLERCEICCEAVCNIARDQAADYFIRYELKNGLAG